MVILLISFEVCENAWRSAGDRNDAMLASRGCINASLLIRLVEGADDDELDEDDDDELDEELDPYIAGMIISRNANIVLFIKNKIILFYN